MSNPETVICVGAVVMNGDRVLLVRQSKGHSLEGQWTVPWGRIEEGESPVAAVLRETKEEGGIEASVTGLLGVQELPPPQEGWIALVYLCKHISGNPKPMDRETDAACYFTLSEFEALSDPKEPWSEWLIRRVFSDDYTLILNDATNPLKHQGTFL